MPSVYKFRLVWRDTTTGDERLVLQYRRRGELLAYLEMHYGHFEAVALHVWQYEQYQLVMERCYG